MRPSSPIAAPLLPVALTLALAVLPALGAAQTKTPPVKKALPGNETATKLAPGSDAPPLAVDVWLQGAPLPALNPARTYVVEFVSSWSGRSEEAVTDLARGGRATPDATFLAIAVDEEKPGDGRAFAATLGEMPDFSLAASKTMATTWLAAAGQGSVPTAFVIRHGKIVWIGPAEDLDAALSEVRTGTLDAKKVRAQFDADAARLEEGRLVGRAIAEAEALFERGDLVAAKTALAKIARAHPKLSSSLNSVRFAWLATENPRAWEVQALKMGQRGVRK